MFKETKNIDSSFRHIKIFTFLVVAGCFLLCGFVLYKSYELSARVQDKIYILAGDQAMEAFASKRKDNVLVEAKSHISLFHIYFFTLDPDDKVIEKNISKALSFNYYVVFSFRGESFHSLITSQYVYFILYPCRQFVTFIQHKTA